MFRASSSRQSRLSTKQTCVTRPTASATPPSASTISKRAISSAWSRPFPSPSPEPSPARPTTSSRWPSATAAGGEATLVAPAYTPELGDQAICHRNVTHNDTEGIFISTRLLGDRFALAFEFFINIAHAFVDVIGVPEAFDQLVWGHALADVRGETSLDAWESRNLALSNNGTQEKIDGKPVIDEKARNTFLESAFSDAVAIYQLSLSVDFDYSELREREYPLLAPQALADRLRLVARLFPPNPGYEFAIRYRRRA